MTSRERIITVINGGIADRPPIVANFTKDIAEKFAVMFDLPVDMQDSFLATRISHRDILLKLGNDAVLVAATRAKDSPTVRLDNGNLRDEWGIEYALVGLYDEAVVRPLAECETIEDLNKYKFPKASDEGRFDHAKSVIDKYKNDYGVIGDMEATIFEIAWNLVGMEKFIMDLAMELEYVPVLLDRCLEYAIGCAKIMIDLGVDMLWTGDDVGTQKGMMISPDMWREYFKPRMKKLFDAIKEYSPTVKIAYHSCGSIRPIIDDLIEIGLDVLNPLQPLAYNMDIADIYKNYSDKLVLFGGICVQEALPKGTVKDVQNEVKRCYDATDGGKKYIIAPSHNIQPDTPVENVLAFFESAKKLGEKA